MVMHSCVVNIVYILKNGVILISQVILVEISPLRTLCCVVTILSGAQLTVILLIDLKE